MIYYQIHNTVNLTNGKIILVRVGVIPEKQIII